MVGWTVTTQDVNGLIHTNWTLPYMAKKNFRCYWIKDFEMRTSSWIIWVVLSHRNPYKKEAVGQRERRNVKTDAERDLKMLRWWLWKWSVSHAAPQARNGRWKDFSPQNFHKEIALPLAQRNCFVNSRREREYIRVV